MNYLCASFFRGFKFKLFYAILTGCIVTNCISIITHFPVIGFYGIPLFVATLFSGISSYADFRFSEHERIRHFTKYISVFLIFINIGIPLSYFTTVLNFPLVDDLALEFDRSLGFDWIKVMHFVDRYPIVVAVLRGAYGTIWIQAMAVIVLLSATNRETDLGRFVAYFAATFLITLILSILLPDAGVLTQFPNEEFEHLTFSGGRSPIRTFLGLRDGSIQVVDVSSPLGLIQFPSMHAAMCLLLPYAVRNLRRIRGIFVTLNFGMLISTATEGGHYIFDIVGGILVVIGAIKFTDWMLARLPAAKATARAFPPSGPRLANSGALD